MRRKGDMSGLQEDGMPDTRGIIPAMSLATRCTHCGTIFKVVQDQLKVSEGWVRCGRCQQVFNALDGLFDLDRDPPPQRSAGATARPAVSAGPTAGAAQQASAPRPASPPPAPEQQAAPFSQDTRSDAVPSTSEDDALDSRWLMSPARDGRSANERQHRTGKAHEDFADAQFPQDLLAEDGDEAMVLESEQPTVAMPPSIRSGSSKNAGSVQRGRGDAKTPAKRGKPKSKPGDDTPEFIRKAERRARWQSPAVKGVLSLVGGLLAVLLGLQAALHFHNQLAARFPETEPLLTQLCAAAGCDIQAPMQLDDLIVDSVTLTRTGAGAGAETASDSASQAQPANSPQSYRLDVVLRNHASWSLAAPHIELSLNDPDGGLITRRTLSLAEFGFREQAVPANSATPLQLMLSSQARINGYTVEVFYP